ncbi:hypothetical protein [Rhizobium leguminosarum]|uniref:hypothetical protein n=1 Tax=Rhizobium leguminosarum TaxID=384 RepID=UPI0021BBE50E|nr:hypothetical protein [Rhizobium leguminosarum]
MIYAHSAQADVEIAASAERVFDYLDDQPNTGAHMKRSSMMMLMGSMAYSFDYARGRSVGSVITMSANVAGLKLHAEQIVTQRQPPFIKAWETRGEPHLLVIGHYRMRFQIEAMGGLSRLHVFIDYNDPPSIIGRRAGTLLAAIYARWCVKRIATDAEEAFAAKSRDKNAWKPSALLLAATGMIVFGIGVYFALLRPPLLPEDIRFLALSDLDLPSVPPRLGVWLNFVFAVLGGFAMATGILTITLAATTFSSRKPVALLGAILGGAASIGTMTVVNFAINSDFKWMLLGLAAIWAASLIAYGVEGAHANKGRGEERK